MNEYSFIILYANLIILIDISYVKLYNIVL